MSTTEDFENASVGRTAIHPLGSRAMKMDDGEWQRWMTPSGNQYNDEEMVFWEYMLESPASTTALEALDLAWDLAHEVKEGQIIPAGTRYLEFHISGLKENIAYVDIKISSELAPVFRTVEPLPEPDPEPEPDWLDAPAILATHPLCADTEQIGIWIPSNKDGVWEWPIQQGQFSAHWSELENVTPFYPKETGK